MKVIDVVYNKLIEIMDVFTENDNNEIYYHSLVEPYNEQFLDLITNLQNEESKVKKKRITRELIDSVTNISDYIYNIQELSSIISSEMVENIYFILRIVKQLIMLNNLTEDNNNKIKQDDIDIDKFKVIPLTKDIKNTNFYYYSPSNTINSIVVYNISEDVSGDEQQSYQEIISSINSIEILAHLLVNCRLSNSANQTYCLIKNSDMSESNIISYILSTQVFEGLCIHDSVEVNSMYNLKIKNEFILGNEYEQFQEVMYILSEFNEQKLILSKYLCLYDVIENFMYRIPICKLIQNSNEMFTIRHFKQLYKQTEEKEQKSLESFFTDILDIEYDGGTKRLKDLVWEYITDYKRNVGDISINKVKDFIEKFGLLTRGQITHINVGNLKQCVPIFVYQLRNVIVHNKETEKHLSYFNLETEAARFLEEVVLPCLLEVIYYLVVNKNQAISYRYPEIKLYKQ